MENKTEKKKKLKQTEKGENKKKKNGRDSEGQVDQPTAHV